ncbi:hypothetical protein LEP1GSC047_1223 [Leptospira inadai serovar Lyme str. 10]|uniref:Uncharacterized protein n=2 Tax=Leptospira inadai serovar Lyme TaxID=293084 RepID=V6H9E6_9LEPT|nr:hypothetical protein LEP1GSC047_1223 [Leptospira inadai serovar Lyme str. 10]PNV75965.1 hypothetical protein BES34_005510 [Leptospira inadai serovar Lyme]
MPSSSKTLIPFPTLRRDGILAMLFLNFFLISISSLFAQPSTQYAKVLCLRSSSGCECTNPITQSLTRLFHGEAVIVDSSLTREEYASVRNADKQCLFPRNNLKFLTYKSGFQPMETKKDHSPKSLEFLLSGADLKEIANLSPMNLGRYYPTYYHLALEEAYPGTIVSVISPSGKEIGKASASFLEQVRWEGSGIATDGTKYHFAGDGRYETYDLEWGWGAGHGFQVFPYRTLAVSFKDLCAKIGNRIPNCNKSKVIGSLALIPKIREKRIRMSNGKFHDGFFCINDTGSPAYIRGDRMDIFVGTHGGGSPYQPKELSRNIFLDAGIQPLVPWDWRFYTSEKEREWCTEDRLPEDPFSPKSGECVSDYHANAPEKGMELHVFFRKDGSLVRCKI